MAEPINGGVYLEVGGSSVGVTLGSDGVTINVGGQASVGYTVSGSVGINYNLDTGLSVQPQVMNGVGTPSGMPGLSISWQVDPSGSGVQQIQVGAGVNDFLAAGVSISFRGEFPPNWDKLTELYRQASSLTQKDLQRRSQEIHAPWKSGQAWIQRRDPLALDLDGDGIETVGADGTVVFDHDGDGLKTGTGWLKGDDAFLVLDRNGNGTIDTGAELFGVDTVLSNGEKATDGFAALKDLDSNGDNIFDASDAQFANVRLWRDLDQDGVSDAGELISLADAGIASIDLTATATNKALPGGNVQSATASFTRADGTVGDAGQVSLDGTAANLDLADNPFYREFTDHVPITDQAAALPDMTGSGKVRDLREAASLPGGLADALAQFSAATTRAEQMALLDPLLAAWAETAGMADFTERAAAARKAGDQYFAGYDIDYEAFGSMSRDADLVEHDGPYAGTLRHDLIGDVPGGIVVPGTMIGDRLIRSPEFDAVRSQWIAQLAVLEAFNGQNFFSLPGDTDQGARSGLTLAGSGSGGGTGGVAGPYTIRLEVRFSQPQLDFLQQSYDALKQSVYDGLVLQPRLKPYLDAVSLNIDETGLSFDFSGVSSLLEARYQQIPGEAVRDLLDLQRLVGANLNGLGWDGYGELRHWLADAASLTDATQRTALLNGLVAALSDFGYTGLRTGGDGTAAGEVVMGADAGETLAGGDGKDLLLGGDGDDTLNGGTGADVLYGGKGNDTYVFNLGDGADTIVESDGANGTDVLQFGAGIAMGDLDIYMDGDKLVFAHLNGKDKISVANWFDSLPDGAHRLDAVRFADGAELQLDAVQLGGAGDDTLIGTSDSDVLMGGAGNDTLISDGNDLLNGGTGADTMIGSIGDDVYVVDNAGDVVIELPDEGNDTIDARVSYTLSANVENLRLRGKGDISGIGNELDNTLLGNSGNNALYGMAGNDTLVAGEGIDTVYTQLDYTLGQNLENLALTGADAVSGTGNELNNVLIGNAANNTLVGLAGNDTLEGGAGADTLVGGSGDDTYIVDDAGDLVVEAAGEGVDLVKAGVSYTLTDNTENLLLTGTANLEGTGSALDNTLAGNSGSNTLMGLDGNDFLDGGAGSDVLVGGAGDDTYVVDNIADSVVENVGEGTDTVRSAITLTLGQNQENLTLIGRAAIDGTGNELDNVLTGNGANNRLDGGFGADTLAGGSGDDTYVIDASDTVIENLYAGTDTVIAPFDYTLGANVENLTLTGAALTATGNELDNVLTGTAADNTLTGLAGNDVLDGGEGVDLLIGGTGDDPYVIDRADDVMAELAGQGVDTVKASLTWTLGADLENLTLTGAEAIDGTGNAADNILIGNSAANVLTGLVGNDTDR